MSFADAREKLKAWRRHYNEDRPHSAIGYNVPIAMHYPMTLPARHREIAGKFQLPAVEGWGAVHIEKLRQSSSWQKRLYNPAA